MSDVRTCLACGHEGHDVAMRLVEVPRAEQRVVEVPIVSAENSRGVQGFDYQQVREAWISEPRCRDKAACDGRVKALEPAAAVEPVVEEPSETVEVASWLL